MTATVNASRRPTLGGARRIVWRALQLVAKGSRLDFALVAGMQIGAGLAAATSVVIVERLLRSAGPSAEFGTVVTTFALMTATSAFMTALQALTVERKRIISELVAKKAMDGVIAVATTVDLATFEDPEFHDRLRRAQTQGQFRSVQLADGLTGLVGAGVGSLGVIVALGTLQPVLIPVTMLGYVFPWVLSMRNSRDLYDFSYEMTQNDRERSYIQQLLTSRAPAKEVRAFGLANHLHERANLLHAERIAELRLLARRRAVRSFVGTITASSGLAVGLLVIIWLYTHRSISGPESLAAVYGLVQLSGRFQALFSSACAFYEGLLFMADYDWFVGNQAKPRAMPQSPAGDVGFELIEVQHVTFTYPASERAALSDVSLQIHAGEVVALVGENGSGKTTLAKVLAGLYTPDSGEVRWDGVPATDESLEWRREATALIFQDFERYRFTAGMNIAIGRHARADSHELVIDAAERADAHRFISALPDGFATILGTEFSRGTDLSEGQWQRVALARALFRDAPLVILDEPTASMDPRAESELFGRIRDLTRNRAVVLISHRFSSVRLADRIYVLHEGRIVEHGSHDELIEQGARYAELFHLQAAAYLGGHSVTPAI